MPRFPVDVVMERIALASRWASERWQPQAVHAAGEPSDDLAPAPLTPPVCVEDSPQRTLWRFGGHALELHRSEGEGYYLNLTCADPKVFVMWRPSEDDAAAPFAPALVTVSYNEAARMLDAGEQVEPVPMPPAVRAWLEPFVAAHYKPEPRRKSRRNDPFAADDAAGDARGPRR